ncbi:UDP-2,4-diacetamido-2,4,6-trideoxy-beta-L-altropyranose hydrolase [Alkalihalobacillus sp. AL-G]|uniref:UDP-2,4-diacetamido-2,4, 6-trideoxy-beta-L-altropyranose hydrolase n=1 Tax=Alkalihalobacillus sp. AL-G TaxID=2926399 RepID=UPI00272D7691|nr:UDP-2,4-diacetamido-2,4,6-trideoxy-beta-L-altropyranose hydrolase [Alkalihalobacillus sp. AL-G]WLD93087.1 UDP-2,4-diacetamido-2,4,6-trideoxy-beta-L-altropyranose hydrolase [Alkalihalobacillus sp. AL-G]
MMEVLIRTDASVEIGTGHVMRCLTLAKQLVEHGVEVTFLCRDLEGELSDFIHRNGFDVYLLPKPNIPFSRGIIDWYEQNWMKDKEETVSIIKKNSLKADLLIVDHYGLDYRWETSLRTCFNSIMAIDDLADRNHNCDLLLDQNFYKNYTNRYDNLVPNHCKLLLGPKNVLLREEFLSDSIKIKKRTGSIKKILVFFGGSDPTNETLKTLKALVRFSNLLVDVVVGASNKNKLHIKKFCEKYTNFTYSCQVPNMAERINEADLAIGAGGTTTWERCCLGLPTVSIIVAENQSETTRAVSGIGAIVNLGTSGNVSSDFIYNEVDYLLHSPERVNKLSENSLKLIDREYVKTYPVAKAILEACDDLFR